MKHQRKIKWWVWLVRILILIIIMLSWWTIINNKNNGIPTFEEQMQAGLNRSLPTVDRENKIINSKITDKQAEEKNILKTVESKIEQVVENIKKVKDSDTGVTKKGEKILLSVPFTPQAPFAEWEDDRFQEGCEEASVLMAMRWVRGEKLSRTEAKKEILAMSAYQQDNYGSYHDTNAADTIKRLFQGYYNYNKVRAVYNFSAEDIKDELYAGNLVLVLADGRLLNNPYFTQPGPPTHMIVIKGYDPKSNQFIANDPGTKRGNSYKYDVQTVVDASFDYPTGYHESITVIKKAMIVVEK